MPRYEGASWVKMQDFKGVVELVLTKLCRLLIRSSNLREGSGKKMLALGPGARTLTPPTFILSCLITARIVGNCRTILPMWLPQGCFFILIRVVLSSVNQNSLAGLRVTRTQHTDQSTQMESILSDFRHEFPPREYRYLII